MKISYDRFTILAYLYLGFFMLSRSVLAPFITYRSAEGPAETSLLGAHITVSALGIMLMGLFWNRIAPNFNPKIALMSCGFLLALGSAGLFSSSLPLTFLAAFLLGAAGSGINISLHSALADHHGEAKKIAIGQAALISSIFGASAPLLLSLAENSLGWGWRAGLFVPLLMLLPLLFLTPGTSFDQAHHQLGSTAEQKQSKKVPPAFWGWLLLLVLCSATEWTVLYWGSSFLHTVGSLPLELAVATISCFVGFQILGRFLWTWLSRFFTVTQLLFCCLIVAMIGLLGFYFFTLHQASFIFLLFWVFIFSFGISGTNQFNTVQVIEHSQGKPSFAMSRISLAAGLSVLLFPWLLGTQAEIFSLASAFLT
ncbi:MAG: MFS transporter, partial [Rothia sp. (in: high G+C Gram-positive bacteria)]|nr:MFS transporter [Rothia sp. (in: high G+C Gram-positive bacteria)]